MNSMISCSRFVAAALCVVLLVGCDSIKDVRDKPSTDIPSQKGVIGGTITGLGTARALQLTRNGQPNCLAPDRSRRRTWFRRTASSTARWASPRLPFSFGAVEVNSADASYNIAIVQQPYGKICSVANASGHAGAGGPSPAITCINEPAVPRYDLTVTIPGALQSLPSLQIELQSEDGFYPVNATGLPSVHVHAGVAEQRYQPAAVRLQADCQHQCRRWNPPRAQPVLLYANRKLHAGWPRTWPAPPICPWFPPAR